MENLEDTMNLPLFGILFMTLTQMCFDAFSAVTVKYWFTLSLHAGNCLQ